MSSLWFWEKYKVSKSTTSISFVGKTKNVTVQYCGSCRSPDSELDTQLSHAASSGFIGCFSAVLFNSVSPLKAALQPVDRSPVVVGGTLLQSSCSDGASAGRGGTEATRSLSGGSSCIRESEGVYMFASLNAVCTFFCFWAHL